MANEKKAKRYLRFDIHQRIQHVMMFVSFIGATISGLPIRFYETAWASLVVRMFGGFDSMFTFHLWMAALMLLCCVYHLIYLVVLAFRGKWSWATMPNLKDVKDLYHSIRYFVGKTDTLPRFERYSYKEKFDYWAVFWGMFIIGGSGLMLWFPEISAQYFPRWVLQSARIAHSDEAMLAILAIFVWHFYNVHFNPTFFPGNRVWFMGYLTREEIEREHPLELERLEKGEGPVSKPVNPNKDDHNDKS